MCQNWWGGSHHFLHFSLPLKSSKLRLPQGSSFQFLQWDSLMISALEKNSPSLLKFKDKMIEAWHPSSYSCVIISFCIICCIMSWLIYEVRQDSELVPIQLRVPDNILPSLLLMMFGEHWKVWMEKSTVLTTAKQKCLVRIFLGFCSRKLASKTQCLSHNQRISRTCVS